MMLEKYYLNQKYYCNVNPVMPGIHADRCRLIVYLVGGSHLIEIFVLLLKYS